MLNPYLPTYISPKRNALLKVCSEKHLKEQQKFILEWENVLKKEHTYVALVRAKEKTFPNQLLISSEKLKELAMIFEKEEGIKRIKRQEQTNLEYTVSKGQKDTLFATYPLEMGRGFFGKAKLAQNLNTQEFCIVKSIGYYLCDEEEVNKEKNQIEDEGLCSIENEIANLKKYGLFYDYNMTLKLKDNLPYKKHYIFMKNIQGITIGRFQALLTQKNRNLTKCEQAKILLCALTQLEKLFLLKMVHCDLHGENIMIDPYTLEVELIDFGLSKESDQFSLYKKDIKKIFTTLMKGEKEKPIIQDKELKQIVLKTMLAKSISTINKQLESLKECIHTLTKRIEIEDRNNHCLSKFLC